MEVTLLEKTCLSIGFCNHLNAGTDIQYSYNMEGLYISILCIYFLRYFRYFGVIYSFGGFMKTKPILHFDEI